MSTKFEQPLEASQRTHLADMPPMEVVTEGIPPQEHIEIPPVVEAEATPERRGRMLAWAMAGVIGFLLVVAGIVALAQYSSPSGSDLHMGLTPQAWQEFRADERVSTTPFHLGLTLPAWQEYRADERASEPTYSGPLRGDALPYIPYWSIPAIAPMTSMSIPSTTDIPAIPAISVPSIEPISMPSMTMPSISMPSISIPSISIPAVSTPATPVTAPTAPTAPIEPISIAPIEPISVPSISIPEFPTIEPISVPSIASIPAISIPEFPTIPAM